MSIFDSKYYVDQTVEDFISDMSKAKQICIVKPVGDFATLRIYAKNAFIIEDGDEDIAMICFCDKASKKFSAIARTTHFSIELKWINQIKKGDMWYKIYLRSQNDNVVYVKIIK